MTENHVTPADAVFLSHQNSGVRLILTTRGVFRSIQSFPTQPAHERVNSYDFKYYICRININSCLFHNYL